MNIRYRMSRKTSYIVANKYTQETIYALPKSPHRTADFKDLIVHSRKRKRKTLKGFKFLLISR